MPNKNIVEIFKVVSVHPETGELISYNQYGGRGPFRPMLGSVIYTPGKWTKPIIKGTPLYAYRAPEFARPKDQLWTAHASNPRIIPCDTYLGQAGADSSARSVSPKLGIGWSAPTNFRRVRALQKYWDRLGWKSFPLYTPGCFCTSDILLCEQIKLIEKI
jgi:hypothetical protein